MARLQGNLLWLRSRAGNYPTHLCPVEVAETAIAEVGSGQITSTLGLFCRARQGQQGKDGVDLVLTLKNTVVHTSSQ